MKWITIKLNMLPLLFQEIDMVTETYIGLLQKLMSMEKEKEKDNDSLYGGYKGSKETDRDEKDESQEKKDFNQLREEVKLLFK